MEGPSAQSARWYLTRQVGRARHTRTLFPGSRGAAAWMSASYADSGKNLPRQVCFQLRSWGREGQAGLLQPWPLGQGHPSTEGRDYKKVTIWESAHKTQRQIFNFFTLSFSL